MGLGSGIKRLGLNAPLGTWGAKDALAVGEQAHHAPRPGEIDLGIGAERHGLIGFAVNDGEQDRVHLERNDRPAKRVLARFQGNR